MTNTIRLTRRLCYELRSVQREHLRAVGHCNITPKVLACHRWIEEQLAREHDSGTVRGGRTLTRYCLDFIYDLDADLCFGVLRDLLLKVLATCTQMQVRAALKRHIATLDEWSGTSAVEALGRIVQMRSV